MKVEELKSMWLSQIRTGRLREHEQAMVHQILGVLFTMERRISTLEASVVDIAHLAMDEQRDMNSRVAALESACRHAAGKLPFPGG